MSFLIEASSFPQKESGFREAWRQPKRKWTSSSDGLKLFKMSVKAVHLMTMVVIAQSKRCHLSVLAEINVISVQQSWKAIFFFLPPFTPGWCKLFITQHSGCAEFHRWETMLELHKLLIRQSSDCPAAGGKKLKNHILLLSHRRCEEALGPSELCRQVDGFKVRAHFTRGLRRTAAVSETDDFLKKQTYFIPQVTNSRKCQRRRLVRSRQDEAGEVKPNCSKLHGSTFGKPMQC